MVLGMPAPYVLREDVAFDDGHVETTGGKRGNNEAVVTVGEGLAHNLDDRGVLFRGGFVIGVLALSSKPKDERDECYEVSGKDAQRPADTYG